MRILFFVFLTSVLASQGYAQIVLTGKVSGADGKPMINANVFLRQPFDTVTVRSAEVSVDGKFELRIPSRGVWLVIFSGVHNTDYTIALYLDKQKSVDLDDRLGAYTYLDSFDNVKAFGSFNNWYNLTAIPLHKKSDGTYVTDVETKDKFVSYRLTDVRYGGSVEGTQPARYDYKWPLGYESIIPVQNGVATIVFDPRTLVRSDKPPHVTFVNASQRIERFNEIFEQKVEFQDGYRKGFREYIATRGRDPRAFVFSFSDFISAIKGQMQTEKDPVLRQELYLNLLTIYVMEQLGDPQFCSTALKEITPTSRVWSLDAHNIFFALSHSDFSEQQKQDYIHEVIEGNPVEKVKSALLFDEFMASKMMEDKENAAKYYDILTKRFAGTPEARLVSTTFTHPAVLSVGSAVPSFSVASLNNMAELITNKSLSGKYYLIFFWAAKDPKSVSQLKYLQKAFDRYRSKNFEILALSVDSSYTDAINFQAGQWKMPWLNGYIGKKRDNEVLKAFNAYDIPKAYLVNPEGRIIAVGESVIGDELGTTLKKYLGE